MAKKQQSEAARQTFRQFAWNLAGTLADQQRAAPKPQGAGGKRG